MHSTRESVGERYVVSAAAQIFDHNAYPILICMLGDFRVLKQGQPVALRGNGKAEALLRMLALHTSISRDALLDALWNHNDTRLGIQSLNSLLATRQF